MTKKKLFVVTGASRGMGAAMAGQLLDSRHVVLCISRTRNGPLATDAEAIGATCEQWSLDLSEPADAAMKLQAWIATLDSTGFEFAALINNAAALARTGPIDACSDAELASALRVGLEAPLLLSAAFLRATRGWAAEKRVLNISSGLGRRAMAGQATYCATKAGLDHLTRAMALDEAHRPNGAKLVALAPGVVDTDMQRHLRSADGAGFPDKAVFVGLKETGQLASATVAATRALAYLRRADFGKQAVDDVRDA